jgi:hypothetical protein
MFFFEKREELCHSLRRKQELQPKIYSDLDPGTNPVIERHKSPPPTSEQSEQGAKRKGKRKQERQTREGHTEHHGQPKAHHKAGKTSLHKRQGSLRRTPAYQANKLTQGTQTEIKKIDPGSQTPSQASGNPEAFLIAINWSCNSAET